MSWFLRLLNRIPKETIVWRKYEMDLPIATAAWWKQSCALSNSSCWRYASPKRCCKYPDCVSINRIYSYRREKHLRREKEKNEFWRSHWILSFFFFEKLFFDQLLEVERIVVCAIRNKETKARDPRCVFHGILYVHGSIPHNAANMMTTNTMWNSVEWGGIIQWEKNDWKTLHTIIQWNKEEKARRMAIRVALNTL
jgi:hypothetical protein